MPKSSAAVAEKEEDIVPSDNIVVVDFGAASEPVSDLAKNIKSKAEEIRAQPRKEGGLKDLAQGGRTDIMRINPYLLSIREGWNIRDVTTPSSQAHIDKLARSIVKRGVEEPLRVYSEGGQIIIVQGHCRWLATMRAIEVYNAPVESVPVRSEGRGSSDVDREYAQLTGSQSEALTLLEFGKGLKRLYDLGQTIPEIAENVGYSPTRVEQLIDYQSLPTEVKALVNDGTVSVSLAYSTFTDKNQDVEKTIALLTRGTKKAEKEGRGRVLPKDLQRAKPINVKKTLLTLLREARVEENSEEDTVTITVTKADYETVKPILAAKK